MKRRSFISTLLSLPIVAKLVPQEPVKYDVAAETITVAQMNDNVSDRLSELEFFVDNNSLHDLERFSG